MIGVDKAAKQMVCGICVTKRLFGANLRCTFSRFDRFGFAKFDLWQALDLPTFVNEEDGNEDLGNGDLIGDINWVLCDFWGKGRGAKRSWVGGSQLWATCDPKTGTSRKVAIRTAECCLLV